MEGLSKVKEDFSKSVDNPDLSLSLQVEIKKKNPTKTELWVDINLESTFGTIIR